MVSPPNLPKPNINCCKKAVAPNKGAAVFLRSTGFDELADIPRSFASALQIVLPSEKIFFKKPPFSFGKFDFSVVWVTKGETDYHPLSRKRKEVRT